MRLFRLWIPVLALSLAACGGGDPTKSAAEAMKAGDLAKAEAILDQAVVEKPDSKEVHAFRMVLYRHLSVHGAPDKQQGYLNKSIVEYDALVQALGIKPDYGDMEGSLRGQHEGGILLMNARKPLYGG